MNMKLASASWHKPTLWIDCPHCDEGNDYFEQYYDHECPFSICSSAQRDELKDIEFQCPDCEEIFELEYVQW
jgi:hypothetical protein